MQKVLVVSALMVLLMASTAQAEIKVFDADGQYLGILMDYTQSQGETSSKTYREMPARCTIFIPSIGKYTSIDSSIVYSSKLYPYEFYPFYTKNVGDIFDDTPTRIYYESEDCDGTPYYDRCFDEQDRIYRIGDKYVLGSGVPIEVIVRHIYEFHYVEGCYTLDPTETYYLFRPGEDFPKEQIPFNLPVALPLHFENAEALRLPTITSFSINKDAASTTNAKVTLNNKCAGDPTRYMASESPSFTGAVWKAYSTVPVFYLSSGKGFKTVYFKVKNSTGESVTVAASILKQ
jgi:hypothetical protein